MASPTSLFHILLTVSFIAFCASEKAPNYSFVDEATKAAKISYHNYIIIGGGTTACPLAATLSHSGGVLLLERGGSPYGNPNITDMTLFGNSLSDLSPNSPSQQFFSEDGVVNARARVLGGGTAINAGLYSRGERELVTEFGWDEKLVNDSYRWVEERLVHVRSLKQWMTAVRDGMVEIGLKPDNGHMFDHAVGTKVGGSIFDEQGFRHTAADLLEDADPTGITVLLHATVQRILFRTNGATRPVACGVVFKDASGIDHIAYLNEGSKNEIILSAGALGSPQLLMLSGIGPEKHLRDNNIEVVLDQPFVGKGMADNPMTAILVPSLNPSEVGLIQVIGITPFGSYIEPGCGINLAATPGFPIPPVSPTPLPPLPPAPENPLDQSPYLGGLFLQKVNGPASKGHLELRSLDVNENPKVTFNYFKEPEDLQKCVSGTEFLKKLIKSDALSRFRIDAFPVEVLMQITTNKPFTSTEQFCKDAVTTIWHAHGGCNVNKVIDREHRVLGVNALRVMDMSTFTDCPGTNPQSTLMMLGRYMGVKILKERDEKLLHKLEGNARMCGAEARSLGTYNNFPNDVIGAE